MAVSKRKRQHKVSKGERRSSRPIQLSEIEKALMGKGAVDRQIQPECSPWRGAGESRSR